MIARNGSRQVRDYGPSPAGVDGLRSVNAMALASEVFVSPVERRYLTPQELAAIREQDEPPLRVMALQTRTREFVLPAPRPVPVKQPRMTRAESLSLARAVAWQGRTHNTKVPADDILCALRQARGNQSLAAELVGLTPPSLRERVRTMRARQSLPEDVAGLLRGRGGWRRAA